jgi:hypothetical protein
MLAGCSTREGAIGWWYIFPGWTLRELRPAAPSYDDAAAIDAQVGRDFV